MGIDGGGYHGHAVGSALHDAASPARSRSAGRPLPGRAASRPGRAGGAGTGSRDTPARGVAGLRRGGDLAVRTPIPTGSTPRRTGGRAPGADDVVMTWGIVAITFCLCCGLLVGALALPLYWLPGQLAVLVGFLWAAPVAVVRIRRGAVGLFGHAAASYARRTRLAVLAALALFLVALPAYEWRLLGHGGLTAAFAVPVVVAVVLGMVALSVAGGMAGAWLLLQRQEWEDAKYVGRGIAGRDSERVTRLNRTEVVRRLWRRGGGGAVLLGLALLASGHPLAGGQSLAVPWGVLALLVYFAVGLVRI